MLLIRARARFLLLLYFLLFHRILLLLFLNFHCVYYSFDSIWIVTYLAWHKCAQPLSHMHTHTHSKWRYGAMHNSHHNMCIWHKYLVFWIAHKMKMLSHAPSRNAFSWFSFACVTFRIHCIFLSLFISLIAHTHTSAHAFYPIDAAILFLYFTVDMPIAL